MKRTIPLFIATTAGVVIIVAYFVPPAQSWKDDLAIWFEILAAFAFVLGAGNLLKMHLQKVSSRQAGWGFSVVTIVAFLVTLVVGLGKVGVNPNPAFPEYAWSGDKMEPGGSWFWYIFEFVYLPLASTMFALLAFFIASAAFRAFRAKNIEAILLLGTAFIVLIGRTYAGIILTDWLPEPLRFDRLTEFIMDVFNSAGNRAIMIGISLGIVSLSLKILMGVDRSYLGSEE